MAKELYSYPQTQNIKTSLDITEITPVYWNYLYPGERIENLNFRNLSRMITPIYPTLDSPYIDLYAFAIPKRIFQPADFDLNPDYNSYTLPYNNELLRVLKMSAAELSTITKDDVSKTYNPYTYAEKTSLLQKFGVNTPDSFDEPTPTFQLQLNYLLAYKKIYYDFFRQKQLEQTDYTAFLNYLKKGLSGGYELAEIEDGTPQNYDKEALKAIWALDKINVCNVDNDYLNNMTYNPVETNIIEAAGDWNKFKQVLFKNFVKNEKIMSGIDYGTQKDILLKVWNTDNFDKTSAQLIGFDKYEQTIKQVINQTKGSTDSQALGDVGGLSVVYNEGNLVNEFTANEETVIMVVAVPNYKLVVRNFLQPNEWLSQGSTLSSYNPNLDYIQQTVDTTAFMGGKGSIIGYDKPFNFLRQKEDIVAGEVANNWANWTYSIEYEPTTSLGLDILKARKKPFKDTLISPNQDSFITEWEFNAHYLRTLKPDFIIKDKVLEGN